MSIFMQAVIKTARDFKDREDHEIVAIANVRVERAENKPTERHGGNNYQKIFSHFEGSKPIFKCENFGGV